MLQGNLRKLEYRDDPRLKHKREGNVRRVKAAFTSNCELVSRYSDTLIYQKLNVTETHGISLVEITPAELSALDTSCIPQSKIHVRKDGNITITGLTQEQLKGMIVEM